MMKRKTAVIFGIIIAAQLCLTPYAGVKVQAAELEEGQMFEDSSEDTETFEDASIPDTQSAEKPEENEFGDDDGFSDGPVIIARMMETLKLFLRRMRISPAKICRNLC